MADSIKDRVIEIIAEQAVLEPGDVSMNQTLEDLGIDAARRDKRAQLYAMTDEAENDREEPARPDDIVSQAESAARVRAAMADLPPEQLEVVRLSFVEGAPHSEIADRLGVSVNTVGSRLSKCLNKLQHRLRQNPSFERSTS